MNWEAYAMSRRGRSFNQEAVRVAHRGCQGLGVYHTLPTRRVYHSSWGQCPRTPPLLWASKLYVGCSVGPPQTWRGWQWAELPQALLSARQRLARANTPPSWGSAHVPQSVTSQSPQVTTPGFSGWRGGQSHPLGRSGIELGGIWPQRAELSKHLLW